jgi:hypothetical protein
MGSASFVEWIIARFTTQDRAASIIGDLLEAAPQKGKLWFWLSVTRVLFSLTWRRSLAYAAATALVFFWIRSQRYSLLGGHGVLLASSMPLWRYLSFAGLFLSFLFPYSAIRYGYKDSSTRHLAAAWLLFGVLIFSGPVPAIAATCGLVASTGLLYSVSSVAGRKGALALATVIAFSVCWAKFSFPLYLWASVRNREGRYGDLGHPERIPQLMYPWRGWALTIAALLFVTFISARVHRMLFHDVSQDSAREVDLVP